MPTHGEKRFNHGIEEMFHHNYGWISVQEFFDLLPEAALDDENEVPLEPSLLSRQPRESFEEYRRRIREMEDFSNDD